GRPDEIAGLLVQGDDAVLGAAGSADELVAVDEGRFAVAPAGHHLAVEVFLEVFLPDDISGRSFQTREVAADAEDVDEITINCRSAAGAFVVAGLALGGEPRLPDFLAVFFLESPDHFVVAAVAHAVDAAIGDRRRSIAAAKPLDLPGQRRAVLGPGL